MCDLHTVGMLSDPETQAILDALCNSGCHVARIKLEVKSLEALRGACQRLGLEFVEGQTAYKWFGVSVGHNPLPEGLSVHDLGRCDHAIRVPDAAYEVGVVYRDGAYRLLWDSWEAGGLERALGQDGNRLKQAYGIEAAILEAQRQGYSIWEEQQQDGAVKLHIAVGG